MSTAEALPREERLRSTSGLRGSPAIALSAWRGASGRRYVVGIHSVKGFDAEEIVEAVVIAVTRNKNGIAELVSVTAPRSLTAAQSWLGRLPNSTTELHVHRLADDDAGRAAILEDMQPE